MKVIVECSQCDEKGFADAQCPNDIITQTGYTQDADGYWICPNCLKEETDEEENG